MFPGTATHNNWPRETQLHRVRARRQAEAVFTDQSRLCPGVGFPHIFPDALERIARVGPLTSDRLVGKQKNLKV